MCQVLLKKIKKKTCLPVWLEFSVLHSISLSQHPFIQSSKPHSILKALINDAMEIKLKRQEEAEQREQDAEDDDNSVHTRILMIKSCCSEGLKLRLKPSFFEHCDVDYKCSVCTLKCQQILCCLHLPTNQVWHHRVFSELWFTVQYSSVCNWHHCMVIANSLCFYQGFTSLPVCSRTRTRWTMGRWCGQEQVTREPSGQLVH